MEERLRSDEVKIGIVIRMLNGSFKHRFASDAAAAGMDEISIMHGWILGYLAHNSDREIYQKTLETELCIGKSSVTGLVKLLEENGSIRRVAVPGDARLKKIELTEKGWEIAKKEKDILDSNEVTMAENIDKKDLEIFLKVAGQIKENLDRE